MLLAPIPFQNTLIALVAVAAVLVLGFLVFRKMKRSFRAQATMTGLTLVGLAILAFFFAADLEVTDTMLQVMGGIVVGTLGLSSTTILGNALAGVQMRLVAAFDPGDWIQVGEHFGRVTVRGLFHTEIQTEDRDLTTLPNLYLASHPYKVVADEEGTIISTCLSLGYDADPDRVEECLLAAARRPILVRHYDEERLVELDHPFVQVVALDDFSVSYRVGGMVDYVRALLTCRSELRRHVMEALHGAGIEIVSPTYMTTRALDPESRVLPARARRRSRKDSPAVEEVMFPKADQAIRRGEIEARLEAVPGEIRSAEDRLEQTDSLGEREAIHRDIERLKEELRALIAEQQVLDGTLGDAD